MFELVIWNLRSGYQVFCAERLRLIFRETISLVLALLVYGAIPYGRAESLDSTLETTEQRYWKEHQARKLQAQINDQEQQRQQREQARQSARDLIQAGAAFQSQLIRSKDGSPSPTAHKSIFSGKRDYILLGVLGVSVAIVTVFTLKRHKREAEIRALSGGYLSDGTEVAKFQMPELFASPLPSIDAAQNVEKFVFATSEPEQASNVPLNDFFAFAAGQIREMRNLLFQLNRVSEAAERECILELLRGALCSVKDHANTWDLRPAWQMSSALELLVGKLIEKGKEITPSSLRSVANAVDVLSEVCVPGVRPDLIIAPPLSVMAVDDDPLCLRAVTFALNKAEINPDIADDGEKAVAMASRKSYDVIFMDINMPVMDGFIASAMIHESQKNAETPVIFVTSRSDFGTRAESTLKGGSDLMAKPFLMFEITTKALTYAMRKRLRLQGGMDRQAAVGKLLLQFSTNSIPTHSPTTTQPKLAAAGST